jgi:hypothetical protein
MRKSSKNISKVIYSKVNFFPPNFGKGNFGGKKITFQKSKFTWQRRFFPKYMF